MAFTSYYAMLVILAFLPFGASALIAPLPNLFSSSNVTSHGTTDFAVKLYKQIAKLSNNSENLFISPLSVYLAMAMLNEGARYESSRQIERALNFKRPESLTPDAASSAMKGLIRLIEKENGSCRIANKIWQQKYFCFSYCQRFSAKLQRYYFSEVGEVNFAADPEKARGKINKWVMDSTNGKIPELIGPKILSTDTRFVLTNAIFFQGDWKHPFVQQYTMPAWFTVMNNGIETKKRIQTMYVKQNFRADVGSNNRYEVVELPYKNERFSMIVILPQLASGLKDLEKSLTGQEIRKIIAKIQRRPALPVEVFMPKFTLSCGLKLNNALKALGIEDVFDATEADLSKITGFRGMFVSAVTHKAFINVNEFGTEASGASGVISDDFILDYVRINRPFLFFILHKSTETVVFLGSVNDPTQ